MHPPAAIGMAAELQAEHRCIHRQQLVWILDCKQSTDASLAAVSMAPELQAEHRYIHQQQLVWLWDCKQSTDTSTGSNWRGFESATLNVLQGLNWYTAALQLDADGDAAHAFYQEQQQAQPGSSSQLQQVRRSTHMVLAVVWVHCLGSLWWDWWFCSCKLLPRPATAMCPCWAVPCHAVKPHNTTQQQLAML
jgi:hypothetical protein